MEEIPNIKPNSNKYRENSKKEDYKLEKVAKGGVKKTQPSSLQKFTKAFIPEDSKSIKDYIIEESPGLIKSFLRRLFQSLLDSYLPENVKYMSTRSGFGSRNSNTPYNTIRVGSSSGGGIKPRNTNAVYEYENITFEIFDDAVEVLDQMYECLARYEKVRVFDLYELAGVAPKATDRNYGWSDLSGVKIIPTAEGWIIDLPRAIQLF